MNFALDSTRFSPSLPPHLNFLCPGVDPFPKQPPARQAVAIVTQVGFILAAHINGDDSFGSDVAGDVRCGPLQSHTHTRTHTSEWRQEEANFAVIILWHRWRFGLLINTCNHHEKATHTPLFILFITFHANFKTHTHLCIQTVVNAAYWCVFGPERLKTETDQEPLKGSLKLRSRLIGLSLICPKKIQRNITNAAFR